MKEYEYLIKYKQINEGVVTSFNRIKIIPACSASHALEEFKKIPLKELEVSEYIICDIRKLR